MDNEKAQSGSKTFGEQAKAPHKGTDDRDAAVSRGDQKPAQSPVGSSKSNDGAERGSFDALRADLAKLTDTVSDLASKQVAGASGQVRDAMNTASDTLSQAASDARDQFASFEAELEDRIKRRPLAAVGIALVAGLILGKLA